MNAVRITKPKQYTQADKKPAKRAGPKTVRPENDWSRFDAMSDEKVIEAALSDPDAQPLTPADAKRMRRARRRRSFARLSACQEEFAEHFGIPIGTLRDWEQGRSEPTRQRGPISR